MAATRIAGTAFIKLDGGQLSLVGTLTIQPMSTTREGVAGMDGIHGYKESFIVPYIEAEVTKNPELNLREIERIKDSTVTAECSDGTVYVLRNAWFAGEVTLDAGEGRATLRFEGLECLETA